MDIRRLVKYLIKKYKTNNPFEIAGYLNYFVYYFDFKKDITKGIFLRDEGNSFIFINKYLDDTYKVFTAAHELGHGLMHRKMNFYYVRDYTFYSNDKYEIEANIFAAELLISDEDILEFRYGAYTFDDAAHLLGIPKLFVEAKYYSLTKEMF